MSNQQFWFDLLGAAARALGAYGNLPKDRADAARTKEAGFDGSYNRVAAFARAWTARRHEIEQTTGRGTFVPLTFGAGEAFQFDLSEDWAILGGERTKLQVAHFKLSHSRAFVLRAYPLQTHEMLFDAHNHAFEVLSWRSRPGCRPRRMCRTFVCVRPSHLDVR